MHISSMCTEVNALASTRPRQRLRGHPDLDLDRDRARARQGSASSWARSPKAFLVGGKKGRTVGFRGRMFYDSSDAALLLLKARKRPFRQLRTVLRDFSHLLRSRSSSLD